MIFKLYVKGNMCHMYMIFHNIVLRFTHVDTCSFRPFILPLLSIRLYECIKEGQHQHQVPRALKPATWDPNLPPPTSRPAVTTWGRAWQLTELGASSTYQHANSSQSCHNRRVHTALIGDTPRAHSSGDQSGVHPIGCLLHKAASPRLRNVTDLTIT